MKATNPEAGTLPEEPPRGASNDNVEVTASNQMILAPCSQDDVGDSCSSKPSESRQLPTADSNLANLNRRICIVTTASLPWRTGTAVNPLLRALALTRGRPRHFVTLLVPWLADVKAQQQLYGQPFASRDDQEAWIRDYCRTRAGGAEEEANLRIQFWEGSYHAGFGSIFPTEDICSLIPADEADVAILEEPEHLNWFRVPPSSTTKRSNISSDAIPTANEATTPTEGGSIIHSWGWAHKFRFVVGILHTNYGAYMRQYGMGTALVTAPALNSLSALVVRAYCHRVIRLSETLTSLDPALEVTSNVHGVRDEFLAEPSPDAAPTPEDTAALAPVYFIGKIIWAKGFDSVLELQEAYRERVGSYFGMDVYGGGEDMKSVQRAFFGRRKANKTTASSDDGSSSHGVLSDSEHESGDEKSAAGVFRNPSSLREQVEGSDDVAGEGVAKPDDLGPADVFADLSGKTLQSGAETAAETASAALKVVESVLEQGIGAFGLEKSSLTSKKSKAFSLAPVRSRFKWRKNPLPARFMGVKDHIELRELPTQKIFLNMSTTEVLCTTSAEALAMGKFVILPRHPSNDFFLKFPNCLAYADLDECVAKLQFALQNEPEPLDDATARMLSWEGATDRLYKASVVTEEEEKVREASGMKNERLKATQFHLDSCRRSHFVSNIFSGNPIKKLSSKLSSKSDSGD